MRFLLISAAFPPAPGGVATHVSDLAHGLVHSGHHVCVLTLNKKDEPFKRDGENRLVILKLPLHSEPGFHAQGLYGENVLRAALHHWDATIEADIIHAHDPDSLFIGWMLKTVFRIPLVYTAHRAPSPWRDNRFLESPKDCFMETMKRVGAIDSMIVPSEASARELQRQEFGIGKSSTTLKVIPHGISPYLRSEADNPAITEWITSIKGKAKLIYCPSRSDVHKDVETFLEAAGLLKTSYGDGALVFLMGCASDDTAYQKLQTRAAALGLQDGLDIHFKPFLYKEMATVYRRTDICILPSRHESFGLTVLEAFLFDVPVVAANATALAELINNGHNGLLFTSGDHNDLVHQITRLLSDSVLQEKLTENGRRLLREGDKYNVTTMIRSYEKFYEETFQQHSSRK